MSDKDNGKDPAINPPAQDGLPQGASEFLVALKATYSTAEALFMPYLKHPGVARNFDQVILKLREAGMWVSDTMNMLAHPRLFAPGGRKEDGGDGAQA